MNDKQKLIFSKLSALQQKIATNLIAGMEPADAYYAAGGKSKTRKSAIDVVSKMRKQPHFTRLIELMNEDIVNKAVMTRQEMLEKLSFIAKFSTKDMQSIAAIKELATLQGWYAPQKTMEVPAPPGVAKRYSQEDYDEAEDIINERFH